jgi:predicted short-subunit dehydrogenase-like oxidoreductase (DUF2520 family)
LPGQAEERQTVAVVGTGKVGTAMAHLLSGRGYDVVAVADLSGEARERAASLSGAVAYASDEEAAAAAQVIIITTPDGAIADTCAAIARAVPLEGKKVIHMSGALSLEALAPARARGADVLSIHPMQTFADLSGAEKSLPASTFGVTCDPAMADWAQTLVAALDGRMLVVPDEDKVLYHAAAAIACNLLAMVEYGAFVISRKLSFSDDSSARALTPLAAATVENVSRLGPAEALTGPLARGDEETLRAHIKALEALDPELASMYRAVSRWGLKLVEERGELAAEKIERMRRLLSED